MTQNTKQFNQLFQTITQPPALPIEIGQWVIVWNNDTENWNWNNPKELRRFKKIIDGRFACWWQHTEDYDNFDVWDNCVPLTPEGYYYDMLD